MSTVWVFGDQLNRQIGALRDAKPATHRILMIESHSKIASRRWHVQRAHFIVTSMRRFAAELRDAGFEVDYRFAESMQQGVQLHIDEFAPSKITVTEPNSFAARTLVSKLGLNSVQTNQFLCHPDVYKDFLKGRKALKMEDFYRFQRKRLNVLMEGDNPVGDRWNFDEENRSGPPKKDQDRWPIPEVVALDELDAEVLKDVSQFSWGVEPTGQWATTRTGALQRMNYFMQDILSAFGEHEDAMLASNWHLAHSLLSPYLNLGLL
jgi:deoxyribodipyrimidine photolyase-related protein